ncbi:hypothetical protein Tco_1345381 [Tanacetum coccineum]
MTPSSTSSDGCGPCPFRGFHCCPDGEVGNKGIASLISHLKRLHLSTNERKCVLREAISTDHRLYMAAEETLKVFCQWLCGKCMTLHVVSRACHHQDGFVFFSKGPDDMSSYIVVISKSSNMESKTEVIKGLVLDAKLLDCVFKVPITIVKCIPHVCRLAFSQALKTVLYKVVSQPDSVDAWVRLLLFPRCTMQVCRPKNRQERRSGNRKSLQQSSILKSLATWGKDDGITTLVKSILDGSGSVSFGQGGDGHFTTTMKVLSSSGVALYSDDTNKALEAKHPYKPPPFMPSKTFYEPPLGTRSLRDALCGEGSATATDLLKAIMAVVNLWLAGRCPPILVEFVASAPLTPLLKPDNKIRPIAVGIIWKWLVSKVLHRVVSVGFVEVLLSEYPLYGSLVHAQWWTSRKHITLCGIDRRGHNIWSATGVQQGDPLGTLLFALGLHPLVHKIRDNCKLLLYAWYLDDGIVIRDSKEVARVFRKFIKGLMSCRYSKALSFSVMLLGVKRSCCLSFVKLGV